MSFFDVLIVQPIFNILMAIYGLIPDFGVSIILFTIIIRLLLWPMVKKQLHQTKAMRKMQPQLAKINAKYKNDRQARALAMMELYKEHNISMFGSIGVLLIQLPVLIGIYLVVQIFVSSRVHTGDLAKYAYDFIEQLPVVSNLVAHPDQLNQNFLGMVDLTQHAVSNSGVTWSLLILAVLAAVMQFLTTKQISPASDSKKRLRDIMQEAAEGKEADQSEINAIVMRKMMKFMPIFMFFVIINLPGALALYLTVSNVAAYAQNAIILKGDSDEMETISKTPNKSKKNSKKPQASKRAATATEAKITRIKAKE